MSKAEDWLEKLDYLKEELTDIRMVLDELLHVLRHIERIGLGIYDADAHWRAEGTGQPYVYLSRSPAPSVTSDGPVEESLDDEAAPPNGPAGNRPRTTLFD
jgi:hypothetical protein